MTMRLEILGSSSSGNCGLLITDDCKILIDAGFSARRIAKFLDRFNTSINEIDAVFITHEHTDHCCGLHGLSKSGNLKVFANQGTAQAIRAKKTSMIDWQIFETGSEFKFKSLEISTLTIPHDAYDPVSYIFSCGGYDLFNQQKKSAAWVTDLGYVPENFAGRLASVDLLVLESNHDITMLDENPRRSWSLKQRIKSRHGHLSNDAAFEFIQNTKDNNWKKIFLAHLSKDCNDVSLVEEKFRALTSNNGNSAKFEISVINPHNLYTEGMEI